MYVIITPPHPPSARSLSPAFVTSIHLRSIQLTITLIMFSALRFPSLYRPMLRTISSLPEHREIIMPKVSPTMKAGRLVSWKKKEGEYFEEGEDIAEVESDKATMPIPAREEGYLARIFVQEDSPEIPLGTLLAITVEEEESIPQFKDYTPPSKEKEKQTGEERAKDDKAGGESGEKESLAMREDRDAGGASAGAEEQKAAYEGPLGPAIARLLNEFPKLDLSGITPTGPNGRLLKGDVLAAIEAGTAFGKGRVKSERKGLEMSKEKEISQVNKVDGGAELGYTDVAVSSMRRAIARRLVQSKATVPHRYASRSYTLDAALALRKRLNAGDKSVAVSVNDIMLKGIGVAMRRVPEMNVRWEEGMGIVQNEDVDVSMAVAIEGGLITPIVKKVDSKGLADIAQITKDLVKRAREGKLEPEEFEGGGFGMSNLGMLGIPRFSAIINPPQSGILAVGSGGTLK